MWPKYKLKNCQKSLTVPKQEPPFGSNCIYKLYVIIRHQIGSLLVICKFHLQDPSWKWVVTRCWFNVDPWCKLCLPCFSFSAEAQRNVYQLNRAFLKLIKKHSSSNKTRNLEIQNCPHRWLHSSATDDFVDKRIWFMVAILVGVSKHWVFWIWC